MAQIWAITSKSEVIPVTDKPKDDLEAVRKVVEALDGFDHSDQERIVRWAREKVGLGVEVPSTPPTGGFTPQGETLPSAPAGSVSDIKSFVEAKNPKSDTQFAATVAYYYQFEAPEHLRKESINAQDLQEACRLVGRDRLSRPAQTLVNTLTQGLLDRGERGTYTINTVGENLVAMALPTAAERVSPKRPRRKATPKKPEASAKRTKKTNR